MLAAFQSYLRLAMAPLIERLVGLEAELEDLRRRADGQGRIGTIASVDPAAGTCTVSHGELASPSVRYFSLAAGDVRETRHPTAGEQCLLISYGGGDGSAQAMALCGLPSDAFPPVSDRAELHRRVYPDGAEQSYDHVAHLLDYKNGPLTVKADREGLVVMLGAVGFKLTAAGFSHVGGDVDHDGVSIGKAHPHLDLQNGAVATGTPKP